MKRYCFRLEQVARVRRIQEEQARAELLIARQRLIEAGADVSMRAERFENRPPQRGPASGSRFRADRGRDDLLAMALTAARLGEANAHLLVGQRVDEWSARARELSTVERLDERARVEHAAEADKDEQRELDDLVTSRWARRPEATP
ncbi:MAG: hypothetical protein JJE52_14285 [Acidimicrobiia bacterium]|nr:hypothetical protein [Acidimicrobiia bacterium]